MGFNEFNFFHMFTVKRLHRLNDYRESSSEGLSMLNMLPTPLFRLKLFTSWLFYFSLFRYQFYLLTYHESYAKFHRKIKFYQISHDHYCKNCEFVPLPFSSHRDSWLFIFHGTCNALLLRVYGKRCGVVKLVGQLRHKYCNNNN